MTKIEGSSKGCLAHEVGTEKNEVFYFLSFIFLKKYQFYVLLIIIEGTTL